MFTTDQMKAAHAKVKSGADFPKYIQKIKALGLITYDFMVTDGATIYHGDNGYEIKQGAKYEAKIINPKSSPDALRQIIAEHQQGKTDFPTFCQQVADIGVEKWVIDTQKMMCTYYDLAGNKMVAEPIPEVRY